MSEYDIAPGVAAAIEVWPRSRALQYAEVVFEGLKAYRVGQADSDGQEYEPRQTNEVAKRLREALLAIQERRAPDPFGWTREVV